MKIKSIQMNIAITIPGSKVLGAISIHPDKYPNTSLTLTERGVLVNTDGHAAIVPMSNIQCIVIHPEEVEENGRPKQAVKKS
ncbi:MAG: hypothetical protein EB120_04540 [Proteobacteria bacterium]|nr:hypothetical protein [Pseudomonadota bacterium]